ncbi:KICSTOR complex protein szt2 [Geranomyces variabilis]|uniref:KICSTOR complex protein szt2 n=1 Tax=Geranomyces variabilis TaxID=109894 RepID=A0AAD5XRQ1_9FUNG|nr:KICSTOR complex protein szt2 [Geranomyces variabilis]
MVVLQKQPSLFSRSDNDLWILDRLMKPFAAKDFDDDEMFVVEVSEQEESTTPLHPAQQQQHQPDQLFRMTPDTHIVSFGPRYRVAFVVDKSPSMSVVDDSSGKAKTLGSVAFETLCKCLDGLCRPFSVPSSLAHGPVYVKPIVYVSVIAECGSSYFRGSQSASAAKHAAAHSTRVLIQEVVVTESNLEALCERLYDALSAYEHDMVQARQKDARHAAEAAEQTSLLREIPNETGDGAIPPDPAELAEVSGKADGGGDSDVPLNLHTVYQAIGTALTAVELMPTDCMPSVVLLTDGVIGAVGAGEAVARDAVLKLSAYNAIFTVIQIGSSKGFNAGVNFGHVADNEFLRFLAIAAEGTFLYSSDCDYLDNAVPGEPTPLPNFYHRHLLMRKYKLAKLAAENRYRLVNGTRRERPVDCPRGRLLNATVDTTQTITPEELAFPWDPASKPPLVAEILCGYRDYPISADLSHVVRARLQEGFVLRSVNVAARRSHRAHSKVEIILMMPWFPNVTILYTIKTTWTHSGEHQSVLAPRPHSKPPRIELNILAQHAFAILFINVQTLDEKTSYASHTMQAKLLKLHKFLRRIYEVDDAFKVIVSFETKYALSAIPHDVRVFNNAETAAIAGPATASQNNYWQVLTKIMEGHADSFVQLSRDVVLRSTSGGAENVWTSRHQVAAMYLHDYLAAEWRSFSVGKGVYVKLVHSRQQTHAERPEMDERESAANAPTGFCVLHIIGENECLATLKLTFFEVAPAQRYEILEGLAADVTNIEHILRNSGVAFRPLIVCKKPVAQMLVRFVPVDQDDNDEASADQTAHEIAPPSLANVAYPNLRFTSLLESFESRFIPHAATKGHLRTNRFLWLADLDPEEIRRPVYTPSHLLASSKSERMPLDELAFNLMYYKRLEEGFVPVSEAPGCLTLYREAQIPRFGRGDGDSANGPATTICAIQFVLINDRRHKTVVTELSVEPIADGPAGAEVSVDDRRRAEAYTVPVLFRQHYLVVKDRILEQDRHLLGKLYTFDKIHAIGRSSAGDGKKFPDIFSGSRKPQILKKMGPDRSSTVVSTPFKLGSVLREGRFSALAFRFPVIVEPTPASIPEPGDDAEQVAAAYFPPTAAGSVVRSVPTSPPRTPVLVRATGLAKTLKGGAGDTPTTPPSAARPGLMGNITGAVSSDGTPNARSSNLYLRGAGKAGSGGHTGAGSDPHLFLSIPRQKSEVPNLPLALQSPGHWQSTEEVFQAKTARDRVNLALCKYVKGMLGAITDAEVALLDSWAATQAPTTAGVESTSTLYPPVLNDAAFREACGWDFLGRVKSAVVALMEKAATRSREVENSQSQPMQRVLSTALTESKCYVKVRDAESFLLVFAPIYSSTLSSTSQTVSESAEPAEFGFLTLTVVECVRPRLPPTGIPITGALPFQPIIQEVARIASVRVCQSSTALEDGMPLLEGAASGLDDLDLNSSEDDTRQTDKVTQQLSQFAQDFIGIMKEGFACAFTKSVYAALLQGFDVDPLDLDKAIGACVETSIDIDLTNYLNVRLLMAKSESDSGETEAEQQDDGQDATQARFRELLDEFLAPVPCFSCQTRNVFFYRPKPETPLDLSNGAPLTAPLVAQRTASVGGAGNIAAGFTLAPPAPAPLLARKTQTPIQSMLHLDIPGHHRVAASTEFDRLSQVLECAGTPLFVRTECSFMKQNMSDADHLQIPAAKLPASYLLPKERTQQAARDGRAESTLDFTPVAVGTDFSPVQSADGTRAVLHLLCLTVPALDRSARDDANAAADSVDGGTPPPPGTFQGISPSSRRRSNGSQSSSSGADDDKNRSIESRSLLADDKKKALNEMTRKIEAMLDDEVMCALLPLEPIKESTLRLVEGILCRRHGRDSSAVQLSPDSLNLIPTVTDSDPSLAVAVPLSFVRGELEIDLFGQEFEGLDIGFGIVRKMGDVFYIRDEGTAAKDADCFVPAVVRQGPVVESPGALDPVHGLGISLDGDGPLKLESRSDSEAAQREALTELPASPASVSRPSRPRFWLIAVIVDTTVQVSFFSREVGGYRRLAIVSKLREGITNCCERVNRMYLLTQLNETHVAHRYLIPSVVPSEEASSSGSSTNILFRGRDTDDEDMATSPSPVSEGSAVKSRFEPGRFACSLVFRHAFKLHWRLKPTQALSTIVVALQAFAIANRKDMFVFAAGRSVFYMHVSIEETEGGNRDKDAAASANDVLEPQMDDLTGGYFNRPGAESPRGAASPMMRRSTVSSIAAQSASSIALSPHRPVRQPECSLVLGVFGVDPPGHEITVELVSMIQVKINSLTQHVVGSFLARNMSMKLTGPDLDFILPAGSGNDPALIEWFRLPTYVHSPYLFLLLLRQAVPWLHPLGGADVIGGLTDRYGEVYGWADRVGGDSEFGISGNRTPYEIQFADFACMYNCMPTRNPTPLEAALGPGIMCVCFALLDSHGKVMVEAPCVNVEGSEGKPLTKEEVFRPFADGGPARIGALNEWSGHKLAVEVWCHGGINIAGASKRLDAAVRNTIFDYAIEYTVGALRASNLAEKRALRFVDSLAEAIDVPFASVSTGSSGMGDVPVVQLPRSATSTPASSPDASKPQSPGGEEGAGFSQFYATASKVLAVAAEDSDTETVKRLVSPVTLPSWIIEEFVGEVQELLASTPTVTDTTCMKLKAQPVNSSLSEQAVLEFEEFRPTKRTTGYARQSSSLSLMGSMAEERADDVYVTVACLEHIHLRNGNRRRQTSDGSEQKFLTATDGTPAQSSLIGHAIRFPQHEDSDSDASSNAAWQIGTHRRRVSRASRSIATMSLNGPVASSPVPAPRGSLDEESPMLNSAALHPALPELGTRSRFLLMTIRNNEVSVYTYNWRPAIVEVIFTQVLRVISWNHLRIQFLEKEFALLQQKGLSARHMSFRVPSETVENEYDPVPPSYGGDTSAMAMATQFQQKIAANSTMAPQSVDSSASTDPGAKLAKGMDIDILQRHAVEFLDWLVRHLKRHNAYQDAAAAKESVSRAASTSALLTSPFLSSEITNSSTAAKRGAGTHAVTASDIATILRSVHLLHFVKYPIIFTELREQLVAASHMSCRPGDQTSDELFAQDLANSPAVGTPASATPSASGPAGDVDERESIQWYRHMLDVYMADYVSYLQHLGLKHVAQNDVPVAARFFPPASLTPHYWTGNTASVETDVAYLVQWFANGVIVAQVGVDGIFGCINVYTLALPAEPGRGRFQPDQLPGAVGGQCDGAFEDACKKLKSHVHLNSYLYDFHLRYFQRILERRVPHPLPVDLLLVMKNFTLFNPRKANFARSRIHRGSCVIDEGQVSSSLFQYILKNPLRYGFYPVMMRGQPIACSLTSTSPDFSRPGSGKIDAAEQPENVYTLIVYSTAADDNTSNTTDAQVRGDDVQQPQPQQQQSRAAHQRKSSAGSATSGKLCLRYFLLVVNRNPFPHPEADNSRSTAMGTAMLYDPLHEYLAEGYYLKDIVRHAERKVDRLIEQAIRYYGRDNLWRQLVRKQDPASVAALESPAGTHTDDGIYEWAKLFLEKIEPNSRPLQAIDPGVAALLATPRIPWMKLLDHLERVYRENARTLRESENGQRRHLVLLNPRNEDYLLHFVVELHRPSHPASKPMGSPSVVALSNSSVHLPSSTNAGTGTGPSPTSASTPNTHLRASSASSATDPRLGPLRRGSGTSDASAGRSAQPVAASTTSPSRSLDGRDDGHEHNAEALHAEVDVFAVSREGVVDELEYDHISQVVTTISAWLWRETALDIAKVNKG